jgi:hypothetical protein
MDMKGSLWVRTPAVPRAKLGYRRWAWIVSRVEEAKPFISLYKFMMPPPPSILVRDLITSYLLIFDISVDDKSIRYVAVGNIAIIEDDLSEPTLSLAGRYFKRWDKKDKKFISKIVKKYPDD